MTAEEIYRNLVKQWCHQNEIGYERIVIRDKPKKDTDKGKKDDA